MKKTKVRWILFSVCTLIYILVGLSQISFNIDILRLLPSHLRQVEGLSLFLKNFAQPNELIVTIEAADAETAEATADALAAALQKHPELVKNAVARPPWEKNPASLSEFLTFLLLNQSAEKIAELQQRISPSQAAATLQDTLEELNSSVSPKDIALLSYDPFGIVSTIAGSNVLEPTQKSEFSSSDGKFRVVYVETAHPFANYKQTDAWLTSIREICAATVGKDSMVQLGFTGEPAFVAEISTGMEWDMASSALMTLALISLIFWLCYTSFAPLRWLLGMLLLIFVLSLATAGLFLNQITVIGAGFASVMIGLSVDYGYFIYQQSLYHSGSVRELQRKCSQNIFWTASTTAAAFFAMNFSSLPGLSQLGNMVGIGVCVGALVMLGVFAPLAMQFRQSSRPSQPSRLAPLLASTGFVKTGEILAVALVVLLLGGLWVKGFPDTDFSASTFRPKFSESQNALEHFYSRLTDDTKLLSLIVSGTNEDEVFTRLQRIQSKLEEEKKKGTLLSFYSAAPLWPNIIHQQANLATVGGLVKELPRLREVLLDNGFTEGAYGLTGAVFQQAKDWQNATLPLWPQNESSRWILRRLARHQEGNFLALGMIEAAPGQETHLDEVLRDDGVFLVSWNTLGAELQRTMPREILHISLALIAGILLILTIGLRSFRAVALFAATTGVVLACLAGAMSLLGMKWGFFNLAAVLLLLGTGTDYSILLLLALKRNGGDCSKAQRELALVIFLCCTSAAAGFGSLAWASNTGLATLGKTCALGLLIDGIISLFLLPKAWNFFYPPSQRSQVRKS